MDRYISSGSGWLLMAVVLLMGGILVGCGDSGPSSSDAEGHTVLTADGINDGATPMVGQQTKCPVCGEPIKSEVHTESKEERVYFDKQECLEKWKQNPQKYKQKLMDQDLKWAPPPGQA